MMGDGPFFSDRPSPIEWPSSEVTRHDWRVERGCASKGCPGVPMIEGWESGFGMYKYINYFAVNCLQMRYFNYIFAKGMII